MPQTYTVTQLINTTYYSESFDYSLSLSLAGNRQLANNKNFMENKSLLRTEIDSANAAISEMFDVYASQKCLNSASYLINNPNLFN